MYLPVWAVADGFWPGRAARGRYRRPPAHRDPYLPFVNVSIQEPKRVRYYVANYRARAKVALGLSLFDHPQILRLRLPTAS